MFGEEYISAAIFPLLLHARRAFSVGCARNVLGFKVIVKWLWVADPRII